MHRRSGLRGLVWTSTFLLVFGAGWVAFTGCSSENNSSPGGATGSNQDGSTSEDGAADVADGDGSSQKGCYAAYSGQDNVCLGEIGFCNRCPGVLLDCEKASIETCEPYGARYGTARKQAMADCLAELPCDRDAFLNSTCVAVKMGTATPSAKQVTMREHYCTRCGGADIPGCNSAFYVRDPLGDGSFLLDYNDTLIGLVDTQCASSGAVTCDLFVPCAYNVLNNALPPLTNPCADGG